MTVEQHRPDGDAKPSGTKLGGILAAIRQWRFPREFRIAAPVFPSTWQDVLNQSLREGNATLSRDEENGGEGGQATVPLDRFLADLGTSLWRLRLKMLPPGVEQPSEEMRRPYRHAQAMWDALNEAGVEIHDHTGEVVPEGGDYGLKVLACQPTAGVGREIVLETIKPTIRWQRQTIQIGEVILAKPEGLPDENAVPTSRGAVDTASQEQ